MTPGRPPQAKGTTIVDLVKLARQSLAAFESILPAETRGVLLQRILPGSWYPEEALRDLLIATDRLRGRGDLLSCQQLGRLAASKDLQGVYRAVLVAGDPQATLQAFPTIWSLYHDTGTITVERLSPKAVRLTLRDHGLPSRALCLVTVGWVTEAVAQAGGQLAQAAEEGCRCQGQPACSYRVAWA